MERKLKGKVKGSIGGQDNGTVLEEVARLEEQKRNKFLGRAQSWNPKVMDTQGQAL